MLRFDNQDIIPNKYSKPTNSSFIVFDFELGSRRKLSTIESLEKEKAYFIEKIETDRNRIHELKTNKKNLEKFAREQYLMKKENEDIFILIEE